MVGRAGGQDLQPCDWKSSTSVNGERVMKHASLCTCDGSVRDMVHAAGVAERRQRGGSHFWRVEDMVGCEMEGGSWVVWVGEWVMRFVR